MMEGGVEVPVLPHTNSKDQTTFSGFTLLSEVLSELPFGIKPFFI